ncbi:hypothetical protein TU79_18800 [Pseudomonas trivialis]|uniref:Uncharacterized protein n=1 Tax=Pseudomonas trivialis TaxID=200450 RepID=A0A0R2ZDM7_9PSED|nr:hypothetical protein TU79_18800 [Pseudomonas trivialis]
MLKSVNKPLLFIFLYEKNSGLVGVLSNSESFFSLFVFFEAMICSLSASLQFSMQYVNSKPRRMARSSFFIFQIS